MELPVSRDTMHELQHPPEPRYGELLFVYCCTRERYLHVDGGLRVVWSGQRQVVCASTVERFLTELSELEHACPLFQSDLLLAIPCTIIGCMLLAMVGVLLILALAPPDPNKVAKRPLWADYLIGGMMGFWILVMAITLVIIFMKLEKLSQRFQSARQAELTEFFQKFIEKEIDLRGKFNIQMSPMGTYIRFVPRNRGSFGASSARSLKNVGLKQSQLDRGSPFEIEISSSRAALIKQSVLESEQPNTPVKTPLEVSRNSPSEGSQFVLDGTPASQLRPSILKPMLSSQKREISTIKDSTRVSLTPTFSFGSESPHHEIHQPATATTGKKTARFSRKSLNQQHCTPVREVSLEDSDGESRLPEIPREPSGLRQRLSQPSGLIATSKLW